MDRCASFDLAGYWMPLVTSRNPARWCSP